MSRFELKSYQFRREREKAWRELAGLVEHVERKGIRGLEASSLYRLPSLYRSAVSSLSAGVMTRSKLREDARVIERHTGPDGETEQWTLFAICFEALVRQFFEPDDDQPGADLGHEGSRQA